MTGDVASEVRLPVLVSTLYPETLLFPSSAVNTNWPAGTAPMANTPVPAGTGVTCPGVSAPLVASILNADTV